MPLWGSADTESSGWNKLRAAELAQFASLAYETKLDKAKQRLGTAPFTQLPFMKACPDNSTLRLILFDEPRTGAAAYFAQCGTRGVLAFRGTELNDLDDILADAEFAKTPFPPPGLFREVEVAAGSVHEGFLRSTLSIWPQITQTLNQAERLEQLDITGHSLGGAMAVVAARLFLLAANEPTEGRNALATIDLTHLYTYGQPAVGEAVFSHGCNKQLGHRYWRHTYRGDPIPCLPPWYLKYHHAGSWMHSPGPNGSWEKKPHSAVEFAPLAIATVMSTAVNTVAYYIPSFVKSWLGFTAQSQVSRYDFRDHGMANYLAATAV